MNWEQEIIKIIRADEYDHENVGHNETTFQVCNFIRENFDLSDRASEVGVQPEVSDDFGGEHEPYCGWCDIEGCENEGCSGGSAWQETGYWIVCSKHAAECREGKSQPKMKQKAIDRENSRDKATGYLPSVSQNSR